MCCWLKSQQYLKQKMYEGFYISIHCFYKKLIIGYSLLYYPSQNVLVFFSKDTKIHLNRLLYYGHI